MEQGHYKQLHLWVEGIKYLTKIWSYGLQLQPYEKLMHFSKNLKQ